MKTAWGWFFGPRAANALSVHRAADVEPSRVADYGGGA
eukprot:CAMPEP_0203829076 /NCGR_PEP_ID=MMETSP0115-20131106/62681_1 /ASSEMBLY_ACC=CAM_ASM_000227 /TAXON_ID=33651 /ORGANISM="Bicosoecid sp, Strain ms1" /LENGTH=37 /DNA_ID= /DNA_START= /DNA_END= /DNA_ORIENTATION=